jgi:hypothetical protein
MTSGQAERVLSDATLPCPAGPIEFARCSLKKFNNDMKKLSLKHHPPKNYFSALNYHHEEPPDYQLFQCPEVAYPDCSKISSFVSMSSNNLLKYENYGSQIC